MENNKSLSELCQKLSNIGSYSKQTLTPDLLPKFDLSIIQRSLIIKVITDLEVKKPSLKEALNADWQLKDPVEFKDYGQDLFLVSFATARDATRILSKGPWFFKKDLVLAQRCRPNTASTSYNFDVFEVWVHIHGIPIEYINEDCLKVIVSTFGEWRDSSEDSFHKWGSYVRLKVAMYISKPLVESINFPLPSDHTHKLSIKYEKLGRFCKFCGCIGHERPSCALLEELEGALSSDEIPTHIRDMLTSLRRDNYSSSIFAPLPRLKCYSPSKSPQGKSWKHDDRNQYKGWNVGGKESQCMGKQ